MTAMARILLIAQQGQLAIIIKILTFIAHWGFIQ